MQKHFARQLLLLLLAAVLVVGALPVAFATTYADDAPLPTAETIPPGTDPTVSTTPMPDSPLTVSGEEFYIASSESAVMPLATGDVIKGQAEHPGYVLTKGGYYYDDVDENGDPYPIDCITLWRFTRSGKTYFMYCLQPNVGTMGGYEGNEGKFDSSEVWANLTRDQQQLVGLTLIYGCPNGLDPSTTSDATGHGYWMQAATQVIVWEVVLGWRDPVTGELTDSRLKDAFCNGAAFSYDGYTVEWRDSHQYIASYYNQVEENLIRHQSRPSFTSTLSTKAPTIDLYPDGSGNFTATVTDTNGVLEDYTFTDGNGLTFQTSGNDLTITADSTFSGSAVVAPTKVVPSLEKQSFILWTGTGGNAGGQVQVSTAGEVQEDPLPAYFKVRLAAGTLQIIKTSEDGKVAGFQFRVQGDSFDQTYTTDENGVIAAEGLLPGEYTVTEILPQGSPYEQQPPQTVTVTAGETAEVKFHNTLRRGNVKIIKTSEDGKVAGLTFRVQCEGFDKTYTTDENGVIVAGELLPGEYTVTEILPQGSPYVQPEAQTVTVTAGETAEVKFHNTLRRGKIKIIKTCDGGYPGGYEFHITGNGVDKYYMTNSSGLITADELLPGIYKVEEILSEYSQYEQPAPQTVTVTAGETAEVKFHNKYATVDLDIFKTSEDGNVEGFQFRIQGLEGIDFDETYTTDADGYIGITPRAGKYMVTEILPENSPYEQQPSQIVVLEKGQGSVEVFFHNVLRPGEITARKVDPMGDPLAGAKFLLEWQDGTQWKPVIYSETVIVGGCSSEGLENGCLVSGEDGMIKFSGLYPTLQYRLTEVEAPDGYSLLTDYAFVGSLPADTLTVTVEVVNMPVFMLPATGSFQRICMTLSGTGLCLAALLLSGCVYVESKQQQKKKVKYERN